MDHLKILLERYFEFESKYNDKDLTRLGSQIMFNKMFLLQKEILNAFELPAIRFYRKLFWEVGNNHDIDSFRNLLEKTKEHHEKTNKKTDLQLLEDAIKNNKETHDFIEALNIDDTVYNAYVFEKKLKVGAITPKEFLSITRKIHTKASDALGLVTSYKDSFIKTKNYDIALNLLEQEKVPFLTEYLRSDFANRYQTIFDL